MTATETKEKIVDLCNSQSLAVLATSCKGQPYGNIVGFAISSDLTKIYFATLKSTCKYGNLQAEPRVSLTIDNRNGNAINFDSATAVTALGKATIIEADPDGSYRRVILAKHPGMYGFLDMDDCVIISVTVEKYIFVNGIYRSETLEMPTNIEHCC